MTVNGLQATREMSEIFPRRGDVIAARLQIIRQFAGKKILDVGCGNGGYVRALLEDGYDAYGIDVIAQRLHAEGAGHIIQATSTHLPFVEKAFDTVLLIDVLEHVDDLKTLEEVNRVCQRNIIFSVPHEREQNLGVYGITYSSYIDMSHRRYYTPERVEDVLSRAGFKLEKLFYTYPINPSGLFLHSLHMPPLTAKKIGQLIQKLPIFKKFCINVEGIASKVVE